MKNILYFLFFLVFLSIPSLAFSRTITVDWTMTDTTGVLGYKMYYSYNSDMINEILACETSSATARSLNCLNIPIDSYPVYFTIASVTADSEMNSAPEVVVSFISPVQDFKLVP